VRRRDDFENAIAFLGAHDRADGTGSEGHHHFAQFDVGFFERGLGDKSQIAAIGSGVGIFGEVMRHQAEIFAALQTRLYLPDLAAGFGIVLRFAVFEVARIGLRVGSYQNLGHMHALLGEVETRLVGAVELGDVGVGDDDVGCDVLVDELLNAELAADLGFQIVQGHLVIAQLLLELLLGPGSFQLGQLGFHIRIAGQQTLLFGTLEHYFAIDEATQNFELLGHGLLFGLTGSRKLRLLIDSFELGIGDWAVVYRSGNIGGRRFLAGRCEQEQHKRCQAAASARQVAERT